MKHSSYRTLAVAVLALLAIAACAPRPEQPDTLPVRAVITPGAPATPYPHSQLDYAGIYQFFDQRGSAPSPYQDGSHQVIPWHLLEPTVGNYDWTGLDSYVADRAGYGLHIGLGFNTTDYSPYHCASLGGGQCWSTGNREDLILLPEDMLTPENQNVTYVVCPLDSTQPRYRLPKYWSDEYRGAYSDFVYALAAHVASTPALNANIDWIELPIGVYGELNPGVSESAACLQELGLTQALWEATVEQMIDIWVDAFEGTGIDLSFEGTNYYIDKGNRQRMNDYAASLGLGLQHAKWHPDWEDMAIACPSCWSRGKGMVDAPLRWENQTMFAIEYPDPPLWGQGNRTTLNHAEEDYWNFAAFLDLKGDVYKARVSPRGALARLTTENPYVAAMIETVRDLAGKDELNAPYAAVWLRETEWGWWPKCNNFDFYLYASTAQEPGVGSSCPGLDALTTDGQAVAVYNQDDIYAPGLCPNDRVYSAACDPRYRYARATAPGHPYIYLDVDPRYRYGTGVDATVSIDYLDVGTDHIKFQWYQGGALQTESRAKTNTRQWQTWRLSLTTMDLTDRFTSGATAWDFRLWDGGDGVETIHSVKFQPASNGAPAVPTATPTATATPAPTATPWHLRLDANNSTWQEALIWARYPNRASVNLPSYTLYANSYDSAALPAQYPTTVSSLLIDVAFDLPVGATINHATLYVTLTGGFLPYPLTVDIRPVLAAWDAPTWINRVTTGWAPIPWELTGAYGETDVGPVISSFGVFESDLQYQTTFALEVTDAVQPEGGLAVKLEPWCAPSAITGYCEGFVHFAGSTNQNLGIRPYLELDLISNIAPTATPMPPATATPVVPGPTPTPAGSGTPTPYPPSLRQGLVINEVCANPVTTDNAPDGVIDGDSALELFNSSEEVVDLSLYRLCVNTTCLWLEGTVQPFGYKVYYAGWDDLDFVVGGSNTVRLYRAGETPITLVGTVAVQSQTPDHCWASITDASPVYVQKYPPTLGRGNNWLP